MTDGDEGVVYTPEIDCGQQLEQKACLSANFWIPASAVPNKDALMSAGAFSTFDNQGNEIVHRLCHDLGDYIVAAKHMFNDWSEHFAEWEVPQIQFEEVNFTDAITPRDETQESAWNALDAADFGVLNLACGKGKTVLALK